MPLTTNRVLIATALQDEQLAVLCALLAADDVSVICVEDSTQAMEALSVHSCALALLDVNLPDGGGLTLCRRLARLPVPVILRLSTDNPALSLDGLEAGALFCLPPSTEAKAIYLHVRNHLRIKRKPLPAPMPCVRNNLGLGKCVLDTLPGAIAITNAQQRVVDTNTAFSKLTGLAPQDALYKSITEVLAPFRFSADFDSVLQGLLADGLWQGELLSQLSDQRAQAFWLYAQTIKGKNGDAQVKPDPAEHHIFFLTDIAHHKRRELRLRTLAETDALTGVANRNLFFSRLNEAIDQVEVADHATHSTHLTHSSTHSTATASTPAPPCPPSTPATTPAILFIDLDHFKEVNDHLGHSKGDELLREIAVILRECVRGDDMVARLGGDEFAVLLIGATPSALAETAQRIVKQLVFSFPSQKGHRVEVTCSIGIAVYPCDGCDAAGLLKQADKAMYRVKSRGRRDYCFASEVTENT